VVISSNVESIGTWVFGRYASLKRIEYTGTIQQWNAIEKESNWAFDIGTNVVVCSDGTCSI
jgi:hypothetical protein